MNNDLISREDLKKSMRKSINERYISWTKTITVADIATLIFDEIEFAPTVDTYTEDDIHYAIKEGHQVGYEMAKAKYGRPTGGFTIDELKLWLYEVASNNDNEFGTDCLEIIDRLDGFLNFVTDMRKEAKGESL